MRYIIDTMGERAQDWGNTLRRAEEKGEIIIREKGDPIEVIKDSVQKMKRAFDVLEKSGINRELLVAYMRYKGVKQSSIDNVLFHQKQFFKKLGEYK